MRYQSFLQETVSKDCRIKQQTGYDKFHLLSGHQRNQIKQWLGVKKGT